MSKRKKFGEILVEAGIVTEELLARALARQKESGRRLGQVLEEMGVASERDTAVVLARQFGFKTVQNLAKYSFPDDVLGLISSEEALKKSIFPLKKEGRTLYLAMVNPLDMDTIDALNFKLEMRIVPAVTTPGEIQAAVHQHYLGARPSEEKSLVSGRWSILVVEDQEMVRLMVVGALRAEGYNVLEASNGAEGLKMALGKMPQLVLTDTVMPVMDGLTMFRSLKANPATKNLPVLALTSKSLPEDEAKLLDLGYFDFISKPVNPVRLMARVRRALKACYGDVEPPV